MGATAIETAAMRPVDAVTRLGPYVLRERLGQGPSGMVYRATTSDIGREIALKVVALVPDAEADSLLRDLQATNEINVASSLRHPGIVRVDRVDAIAGYTTTEMEYVRGMSLRNLLGIAGRLLPERAVAIACQTLDALAYAHARRAIHGNLKPTNVLVRHDGLVTLSDFGFRDTCPDPKSAHAARIHSYAAPEELEDDTPRDRRSDIWSVGVLLFQMLTGRLPFPISDPHDLRAWQRGLKANAPSPLSAFVGGMPDSLPEIVSRALQFAPADRYRNAREFLNALLGTGLCAGMAEAEDEQQERQEATYKRLDKRLRAEIEAGEETELPDVLRAFSHTNPDWEDCALLLHYARVLQPAEEHSDVPEPHAIALTPEEVDHLEEIETRLKILLTPGETNHGDPAEPGPDADPLSLTSRGAVPEQTWSSRFEVTQQPRGALAPVETRDEALINPKDGAEMVLVPAGEFIMGNNGYSEDNSPQRLVSLDRYYMYRNPVTVAQYRRYCEDIAYPMPHAYWPREENEPIVGVTWHEAFAYCEWAEVWLPTEAQWEKAARGPDGRVFPWGNQFGLRSSHKLIPQDAGKATVASSYPSGASLYGVMDMVGNVQQWCLDLYDDAYYKSAPGENPPGPAIGVGRRAAKAALVHKLFSKDLPQTEGGAEQRVVRGSSWKDHHESFAFTFRREFFAPGLRLPWVGFRCVASTILPRRQ